jgi:hypothetical protein
MYSVRIFKVCRRLSQTLFSFQNRKLFSDKICRPGSSPGHSVRGAFSSSASRLYGLQLFSGLGFFCNDRTKKNSSEIKFNPNWNPSIDCKQASAIADYFCNCVLEAGVPDGIRLSIFKKWHSFAYIYAKFFFANEWMNCKAKSWTPLEPDNQFAYLSIVFIFLH